MHCGAYIFVLRVKILKRKRILFAGGDKRSIAALNELKKNGYFVESRGLYSGDSGEISDCDVVVLPVPTTKDGKTVYCPLTDEKIYLSEIKEKCKDKFIITCGYDFCTENSADLLSLDGYAYLNAVPTAEGAIAFLINNTDFTVWNSKILIIGNGRVGKILALRLKALGADLTVSARKSGDFAFLSTQNIKHINTKDAVHKVSDFDVIINTVDVRLFFDLSPFENTVLIDLSTSGCVDFGKTSENQKIYKLPGLPAKTAQNTAGKILAATVTELIKD